MPTLDCPHCGPHCDLGLMTCPPDEETRRLLIEMRKYIVYHGLLIGECVAWNKLKELYGIGDEGLPKETTDGT